MSNIIQSPGDLRKYRHITLTNGLECTLVSDSTTDKASAAMQVNVGHMSDDPRTPGLAHFLEHMLFQGTTTYPGAASYKKFFSDHGGSSNASTGMVTTTYFFDITHPFLELAVDRCAVGGFIDEDLFQFENREFDLMDNDMIYIFSDGYVDQFGGPRGKKLKPKRFRAVLESVHKSKPDDQKEMLDQSILDWMGELEQVDDILLAGFKI